MDYLTVKTIHVGSVALSYTLFVVRGIWMMTESPALQARLVKIAPHVVDTVLVASAIALVVLTRQYPLDEPWLTAKIAALVVYIAIGTVALNRGRTRAVRIGAWLAAQVVFAYIVMVAITRNPLGPL